MKKKGLNGCFYAFFYKKKKVEIDFFFNSKSQKLDFSIIRGCLC